MSPVRIPAALSALVLAMALVAVVLPAPPAAAHTEAVGSDPGLLDGLVGGRESTEAGSGRPAVTAEPSRPADRVTPPRAVVTSELASATLKLGDGSRAPLVVPDELLPFAFHVEAELANSLGLDHVKAAFGQWDGIPGSRWATSYGGLVSERVDSPQADDISLIYRRHDCPSGVSGYATWQTHSAQVEQRYGEQAVYIAEVDVGICENVTTPDHLRWVIAHEVGHGLGLDHLCNPGQSCYQSAMGQGSLECRLMYAGSSGCRRLVEGPELDAARHLYPTLQRLSGPTRVETAARASFADFAPHAAGTVVLARADRAAHGPLAGAALAGTLDGPLLLAVPHGSECVTGAAAEELARAAAKPGRVVLVGDWPASCDAVLAGWDLTVERADGRDPVALGLAVADELVTRAGGSAAFVVSAQADAGGHVPDGVAAGAAAGASGGPVLYTSPGALDDRVADWLGEHGHIDTVYVLGGSAALTDVVVTDLRGVVDSVVRVAGATRMDTAIALANRSELFGARPGAVLATADGWADAVTGSAIGARNAQPVLVTPRGGHGPVEQWLARVRPASGAVVGGAAVVPYRLQWRYTRFAG